MLSAPFPWFGGKRSVAHVVWERFGDVYNYVEPFAGSLAVLLSRPEHHLRRFETVNDIDCYLSNFWRAVTKAPEEVAKWADWPVNEADLHARHKWLLEQKEFREKMMTDPDYYDAKIAGWWVWGISCWIGHGWCDYSKINADKAELPSRSKPQLMHSSGIFSERGSDLNFYFCALAERLKRVRVCCGDWKRVLGPSVTSYMGLIGIFLDPPYDQELRNRELYTIDEGSLSREVRNWAIEHGDNPMFRIALCGYEGEHEMPPNWTVYFWVPNGGYGNQRKKGVNDNKFKERIWFSPHCLSMYQPNLF